MAAQTLMLGLTARAGMVARFPMPVLMLDLVGPTIELPPVLGGGHASYYLDCDAACAPIARCVALPAAAIAHVVTTLSALSWPTPSVTGQVDTSDAALSLSLNVSVEGGQGRFSGALSVDVMAGSYQGPEAPALRALLRALIGVVGLPGVLVDQLRAAERHDR